MTRSASVLTAAFGLFALAACGGGSSTPGTAPATADLAVRAKDGLQWNASSYSATAADGSFVLFAVNDSALAHNLHIQDADGKDLITAIDLPSKGSDETLEVQLEPGTYRIVCTIPGHSATMNATLTVTA